MCWNWGIACMNTSTTGLHLLFLYPTFRGVSHFHECEDHLTLALPICFLRKFSRGVMTWLQAWSNWNKHSLDNERATTSYLGHYWMLLKGSHPTLVTTDSIMTGITSHLGYHWQSHCKVHGPPWSPLTVLGTVTMLSTISHPGLSLI